MEFSPDLIRVLRAARHIAVLTGAGVSAESGIPTFRDAQVGLWARYQPEDLATPEAFERNPKLVWDWYAWRSEIVRGARPNPGHYALAEMQRRVPKLSLITQNVDGFHQLAGSTDVIELHGNIGRTKCSRENIVIDQWAETGETPPRCPRCGAYLRPDVVWFGELSAACGIEAAMASCQHLRCLLLDRHVEPCRTGRVTGARRLAARRCRRRSQSDNNPADLARHVRAARRVG